MSRIASAVTVSISCGSVGIEYSQCRWGAEAWAKESHHQVKVLSSPNNSSERLAQLQLMLAAKAKSIDVFLIDTTWPGVLGDFLADLNPDSRVQKLKSRFFRAALENNTVRGRFIALPWFVDGAVLYYRKDLLEKYQLRVPTTWDELTQTALKIQRGERASGNKKFWGFVFQGRAYEGLTCNALEWISSSSGGTFVDGEGRVTVNNPQALKAIKLAASWIHLITPPGVLNYMEEDARAVFQSGDAAFLRNWPYVWKVAQEPESPVRGKIGMALLPQGEGPEPRSSSTLGGWSLAVSKDSIHLKEAIDLMTYLAGPDEQSRRMKVLGQYPSLPELFQPGKLPASLPLDLLKIFHDPILRPSRTFGSRYNRASSEIWEQVHRILAGKSTGEEGLRELEVRLNRILQGAR